MTVSPLGTLSPQELSSLLTRCEPIVLIDVRELREWAYARIEGARLLPLATLPATAAPIDRASDIVLYCHHGVRSEHAGHLLLNAGFERVRHLAGGIDAWSRLIDPAIRQY